MICCDKCEDWFHGKCVNITKAMGQQMEEQGIEWSCPNCVKKKEVDYNQTEKVSAFFYFRHGISYEVFHITFITHWAL